MFEGDKVSMKEDRGFTLIELGIVIAILAILSGTVFAGKGFLRATQLSTVVQDISALRRAVDVYIGRRGGIYPQNPTEGGSNVLHLEDGAGQNELFSRQLIRQPIPYKIGSVEFKAVWLSFYTVNIMESGGVVIELLLEHDEKQQVGAEILELVRRDPYFAPELSPSGLCTKPDEEISSARLYLCFKGAL